MDCLFWRLGMWVCERPQTQSGCNADARRTHPQAPAHRTQNARVLDAVFVKLFLGSTVPSIILVLNQILLYQNSNCKFLLYRIFFVYRYILAKSSDLSCTLLSWFYCNAKEFFTVYLGWIWLQLFPNSSLSLRTVRKWNWLSIARPVKQVFCSQNFFCARKTVVKRIFSFLLVD